MHTLIFRFCYQIMLLRPFNLLPLISLWTVNSSHFSNVSKLFCLFELLQYIWRSKMISIRLDSIYQNWLICRYLSLAKCDSRLSWVLVNWKACSLLLKSSHTTLLFFPNTEQKHLLNTNIFSSFLNNSTIVHS